MRIYYHDNQPVSTGVTYYAVYLTQQHIQGDCRLPHDSGKELSPSILTHLGVLYYNFPPSSPTSAASIEELAKARHYANRDEITVSPTAMGDVYEDKIKMFYEEHMHEDEETRYILNGAGLFDVRDLQDQWIRIQVEEGDLLILPTGIYHRFTVNENN
ncbi:MAG: hypothetical protein Q9180_007605, partial [Flavoplaca navasiana]